MIDLDEVPGTPPEFYDLLRLAASVGDEVIVRAFPPRSIVWSLPPDGWSIGTEDWMMSIRPRVGGDGVVWSIEYSDDDGNFDVCTIEHATDLVMLRLPTKPDDPGRPWAE